MRQMVPSKPVIKLSYHKKLSPGTREFILPFRIHEVRKKIITECGWNSDMKLGKNFYVFNFYCLRFTVNGHIVFNHFLCTLIFPQNRAKEIYKITFLQSFVNDSKIDGRILLIKSSYTYSFQRRVWWSRFSFSYTFFLFISCLLLLLLYISYQRTFSTSNIYDCPTENGCFFIFIHIDSRFSRKVFIKMSIYSINFIFNSSILFPYIFFLYFLFSFSCVYLMHRKL